MHPVVFVNAVQAAGKSTVCAAVRRLDPTVTVVEGDPIVRRAGRRGRAARDPMAVARLGRARLADTVGEARKRAPVIVDAALTAGQLLELRYSIAGARTVLLEVDPAIRDARHAAREAAGARPVKLPPDAHDHVRAPGLYDIVLDVGTLSPEEAAGQVLSLLGSS